MIDNSFEDRVMESSIYFSKENAKINGMGQRHLGDNEKASHKFEACLVYKQL